MVQLTRAKDSEGGGPHSNNTFRHLCHGLSHSALFSGSMLHIK